MSTWLRWSHPADQSLSSTQGTNEAASLTRVARVACAPDGSQMSHKPAKQQNNLTALSKRTFALQMAKGAGMAGVAGMTGTLSWLAAPQNGWAQTLSAEDEIAIRNRLIVFFQTFTTLRGRFEQRVTPSNKQDRGTLLIRRPGMMRLDYDPPNPIQIVANGVNLIIYNRETQQRTEIPLRFTPAAYVIGADIDLRANTVAVLGVEESEKALAVNLAENQPNRQGSIIIRFEKTPVLRLLGWDTLESDGVVTELRIITPESGIDLPTRLFTG